MTNETTTATETETATETAAYTWPMKECTRCGGTGQYSYNQLDGTKCYGCNGNRVQFASRKVAVLAQEWNDYAKAQKNSRWELIQPGELVAMNGKWRKFVSATQDDRNDQWLVVTVVIDGEEVSQNGRHKFEIVRRQWRGSEAETAKKAAMVQAAWDSLTKAQRAAIVER